MKSPVKFSKYSIIITVIVIILFIAIVRRYVTLNEIPILIFTISVMILLVFGALFYMPLYVAVYGDNTLRIRRPLKSTRIQVDDIDIIELCQPTMNETRIFGSGGWFGYWGRFKDGGIGKYFAYYGKSSDCFLVRLKNGKQYMLGCKNPETIVDEIKKRLS